jgi:uncharacterized protein (TIGR02246 family)
MKLTKFMVIVGMLAWTTLAESSGSVPDSVSEAMPFIRRANTEWSSAMRSGNADRIAAPYAMDAVFVTVDGTSIRGRTAIKDFYRARLAGKAPVVSASIEHRGAAAGDGDLVYEWGAGSVTTRSAGGALDTLSGPYLTVWKRQRNGRWEIVRNVVL